MNIIIKIHDLFIKHLETILFCCLINLLTISYFVFYNFTKLQRLLKLLEHLSQRNAEAINKLSQYSTVFETNEVNISLIDDKIKTDAFFCTESLVDGAAFVGLIALVIYFSQGKVSISTYFSNLGTIVYQVQPFMVLVLINFFCYYFKNFFMLFFFKNVFCFYL